MTPVSALCYSPDQTLAADRWRFSEAAPFLRNRPDVIEQYTAHLLNALEPTISRVPPPYYVGTLLGVVNTCLFYLGFGRGFKLFLPYLALGVAGALMGLTAGTQLPDSGPMLGEVNVVATVASTWTILFIARSLRL